MRWLLSLLVVMLAAVAAWSWRELGQERERVSRLQAEVAQPPKVLACVPAPMALSEIAPARAAEDDSHECFDPMRFKRGLVFSGRDPRLLQSPEYMEARRRYREASFADKYPDLTRVLGIKEKTAIRLVELSYEEQLKETGVSIDRSNLREIELEMQQKALESDAAIAALVGDETLQKWKDYQASLWQRHQVRGLRLKLADSPEPLAGDEAELLIRALYEERRRMEEEAKALSGVAEGYSPGGAVILSGEDTVDFEVASERRAIKVAESVLTPYQSRTFREVVERQRTAQDAMDEMYRVGMEALK